MVGPSEIFSLQIINLRSKKFYEFIFIFLANCIFIKDIEKVTVNALGLT